MDKRGGCQQLLLRKGDDEDKKGGKAERVYGCNLGSWLYPTQPTNDWKQWVRCFLSVYLCTCIPVCIPLYLYTCLYTSAHHFPHGTARTHSMGFYIFVEFFNRNFWNFSHLFAKFSYSFFRENFVFCETDKSEISLKFLRANEMRKNAKSFAKNAKFLRNDFSIFAANSTGKPLSHQTTLANFELKNRLLGCRKSLMAAK